MFNIKIPENNPNYSLFENYLAKSFSFAVTGLTGILRLLLIKQIKKITGKKVLIITSTEQNALKYRNDLKRLLMKMRKLFRFKIFQCMKKFPQTDMIMQNR